MKAESKRVRSRNISSVICRYVTACVVMSLGLFVLVSVILIYCAMFRVLASEMKCDVRNAAHRIQWVIKSYKNIAEGLGSIPELSLPGFTDKVRSVILENRCNEYNLSKCVIVDKNGNSFMDDEYRGDRIYFKEALKGNVVISEPFVSPNDGKLYYVIAAPIWKSGVYNGTVDSVLACYLDSSILNSIVEELCATDKGEAVILGSNGIMVASSDKNMVFEKHNNIRLAERNPKYAKYAVMNKKALEGGVKVQYVFRNLVLVCHASSPIEETPGWVIIMSVSTQKFIAYAFGAGLILLVAASLIVILVRARIKERAELISRPVVKMATRLKQAAVGDFSSSVDYDESIEEIGVISKATRSLVKRMAFVLGERNLYNNNKKKDIKSFVNFAEYSDMINAFEDIFKCKICIFDADMSIVMGSKPDNPKRELMNSILVNGKFLGIYTFYPLDTCVLSDDELHRILNSLSAIAGRSAETLIEHETIGKFRKENERFNYDLIVGGAEQFYKILDDWLSRFTGEKNSEHNAGKNEISAEFIDEIAKARDYLVRTVEFINLSEYNTMPEEKEYLCEDLFNEICLNVQDNKNRKNFVFSKGNLPEKLFGDMKKIARIIARTACCLEEYQENSNVEISVSSNSERFSEILNLSVTLRNSTMSESDVDRINIIWKKKDAILKSGSNFEQRMSAVFMTADLLNATLTIKGGKDLEMKFEIPQLPIRNEV